MSDTAGPANSREATADGLTAWRRLVAKSSDDQAFAALRSSTRDGIPIEPLYAPQRPQVRLPDRGATPWRIVQFIDDADPDQANAQARRDVDGGATGLAFVPARGKRAGRGSPPTESALRIALEGVDLARIHVRLEPHPKDAELATSLADLALAHGNAPERVSIAFGLDPVEIVAFADESTAAAFPAAFRSLRDRGFDGPIAELDGRLYYEAGASEAQELAIVLAKAAWSLRAWEASGASASHYLPFAGVSLAADVDQMLTMAKLRAMRLVWRRMQEACAVPPHPLWLHAETGRRMMTRAEPHTNLLRTTIAAFAAAAGMADSIAIRPFDDASGEAGIAARALARDAHHLLLDEADVHRVADPGAGAGAVEALTGRIAERAWQDFTIIEREGGIVESLRRGSIQARIAETCAAFRVRPAGATAIAEPAPPADGGDARESWPGLEPIRLEELARAPR